jgi:hypothetical protein
LQSGNSTVSYQLLPADLGAVPTEKGTKKSFPYLNNLKSDKKNLLEKFFLFVFSFVFDFYETAQHSS